MRTHDIATWVLGAVGVLCIGFFALNASIYQEKQPDSKDPFQPVRMTLEGVYTCLPHRDTSGPITLECALGLEADNGFYYVVDFMLMSQTPPGFQTGDRIRANGIFTPLERLSSDHLQKYDVVGVFSVTDSLEVIQRARNDF